MIETFDGLSIKYKKLFKKIAKKLSNYKQINA